MRLVLFVLLAAVAPACAKRLIVGVGRDAQSEIANVFTPNAVQAAVGDIIRFEFQGGNHTVTQSTFEEPCTQQFNATTMKRGVDSGFIPYNITSGKVAFFEIQIKQSTSPIWMFCKRQPHCSSGMVFSINAPTTGNKTMLNFIANAKALAPAPSSASQLATPAFLFTAFAAALALAL